MFIIPLTARRSSPNLTFNRTNKVRCGIDSPVYVGGHRRLRGFFVSVCSAAPLWAGPCGEPSGSPVPTTGLSTRTVPFTRLTAGSGNTNRLVGGLQ